MTASMSNPRAERLREAGLRATRPRLDVLAWLDDHHGHHAADEVTAATGRARASIYKVLEDLVEAGLVLMADAGPGRTLYEAGAAFHHHFVCRSCGRIVDVPCRGDDRPCLDAGLPGAEVDTAQVIYRGRCADCLAAS